MPRGYKLSDEISSPPCPWFESSSAPGSTTQRTIRLAKYRFPIYLAYDGCGIGIAVGVAPIEPDGSGLVRTDSLNAKERHENWVNPLKIALYYKGLMEQSRTRAEIARVSGVSRARVTQFVNLLNLHPDIQEYLDDANHDLDAKRLTERRLREIALIQDSNEQLRAFRELIS